MAYTKQTWQNEVLSGVSADQALFTIKNSSGTIINDDVIIELKSTEVQAGSEFTADRMNHIEDGIEANSAAFDASTGHDHDGTDSKKIAASNVDGLAAYFNASTGHDHDGTDSKKVAYSNITGTPTVREILTANRTYYVRTDGNNSNTGLANTAAGAFLTIQKAIDVAASIDCSIYNITIQVADGTYVSNTITCKNIIGSGDVTIVGNTSNPDNCIIDGGFSKTSPGTKYLIQGFKLIKSSGNHVIAINATNSAQLVVGYINFGVGFTHHIYSTASASVLIFTNYTISGSAANHIFCSNGASVSIEGNKAITLVGSLTFNIFCFCLITGIFIGSGNTFTGTCTGTRYVADSNAVIYTSGGGANYFPGSTDGTTATGGLYV